MEYRYTARTPAGRRVSGRLSAPDIESAADGLRRRSFFVTSVVPSRRWDAAFGRRWPGAGFGRSRVAFFRSLATLVKAGVPLRRGLEAAIERTNGKAFGTALRAILADIERGEPLSVAFGRQPRTFAPVIVSMVAAGEAGGILDDVLERIAALLERDDAVRKSVAGALAYPAAVLAATTGLVIFLVARVLPTFATLFDSFHVDLPPSTRMLVVLGDAASRPAAWSILIEAGSVAVAGAAVAARTDDGRLFFDRLRLSLPVVGELLRKSVLARFARMLGTLTHSGIELSAALDAVLPVTGSPVHERALRSVAVALREGEAFTPPLAATGTFDPMLIALIGIGEETGMLDELLSKAADYFEADVAAAIAALGSVIEPALIAVLGAVAGTIVYSVYVPLYSLIGSVSK
jgi:type IV pilus assembly protein PilC